MSDPAPQTPTSVDEHAERRKSIGKYVKRLSTVLRRGTVKSKPSSAAAATSSSTAELAAAAAAPPVPTAPVSAKPDTKAAATSSSTPAPAPAPAPAQPIAVTTSAGSSSAPGAYARSAIQQERARALFAKYGLTLEAHEWVTSGSAPANVQRVEKPIRMRVHRSCHRCGTTFGADRVCTKCEHKRCTKCPRYPPKKPKDKDPKEVKDPKEPKEPKGKESEAEGPEGVARKRRKQLTIRSKSGGELVYQPVRQRIRRTCHRCESLFIPPTATVCEGCQHVRCTKCPREPAKKAKWPNGYPGDASYESSDAEVPQRTRPERTWKRPRQRVRWTCSECSNIFVESLKMCGKCGHERCEKCTRAPPKKKKEKEFDPEFVRRVEERIRALAVQESQPPPPVAAIPP